MYPKRSEFFRLEAAITSLNEHLHQAAQEESLKAALTSVFFKHILQKI